jgi:prepilin-type N-terminal cleavage/methylation domain-containing protein
MKNRATDHRNNGEKERLSAGFSLFEMMVALTVLLIVIASVFRIVSNVQASFRQQLGVTQAQASMRRVLEYMARELATAGANGVGGVVSGSNATRVQVRADLGGCGGACPYDEFMGLDPTPDNDSAQRDEDITYTFSTDPADPTNGIKGKIERRDALDATAQLVAERIKSLRFDYYDENDVALAVPLSASDAIKVCKIKITLETVYSRKKTLSGLQDLTYKVDTEVLVQNNPANLGRF